MDAQVKPEHDKAFFICYNTTMQNKTLFITGATSGFGEATAKLAVAQGHRVVALGRRLERLEALQETLGKNLHIIALDVRDEAAVRAAVAGLPEEFSNIDVLVNNAGLALGLESYEKQKMVDMETMVDTNIKGVLYCTQALLPAMVARGRGHIINVSSIAGSYPYPGGNVYGATKAFLTQFSLNLRADLVAKNIRVSNIEPGMSETEFSLVRLDGDAANARKVYAGMTPLSAEDIANSILWCVNQPEHVNINRMELMPTQQAFGPFAVNRTA